MAENYPEIQHVMEYTGSYKVLSSSGNLIEVGKFTSKSQMDKIITQRQRNFNSFGLQYAIDIQVDGRTDDFTINDDSNCKN